jgi:hypothetical protein
MVARSAAAVANSLDALPGVAGAGVSACGLAFRRRPGRRTSSVPARRLIARFAGKTSRYAPLVKEIPRPELTTP